MSGSSRIDSPPKPAWRHGPYLTLEGGYKVPKYGFYLEKLLANKDSYTHKKDLELAEYFVSEFSAELGTDGGANRLHDLKKRLRERLSHRREIIQQMQKLCFRLSSLPREVFHNTKELIRVLSDKGLWRSELYDKTEEIVEQSEDSVLKRLRDYYGAWWCHVESEAHYVEWRLRVLKMVLDRNDETFGATRFAFDPATKTVYSWDAKEAELETLPRDATLLKTYSGSANVLWEYAWDLYSSSDKRTWKEVYELMKSEQQKLGLPLRHSTFNSFETARKQFHSK